MKGLWIEGNKLICNIEVIATIYCPMQFDNYPMDKQHCPFQVGSFSHNGSYMTFHLDKYVDMNEFQTSVLDYHIEKSELREEYTKFHWAGSVNNYSLTGFEMHLQRKVHNYITNYYLPSGLFVVVSWVKKMPGDSMIQYNFIVNYFRSVFLYHLKWYQEEWHY